MKAPVALTWLIVKLIRHDATMTMVEGERAIESAWQHLCINCREEDLNRCNDFVSLHTVINIYMPFYPALFINSLPISITSIDTCN